MEKKTGIKTWKISKTGAYISVVASKKDFWLLITPLYQLLTDQKQHITILYYIILFKYNNVL